jgi:Lon protease-like protein
MFPLGAVLFPLASMQLQVFEPRYRELTRVCLEGDGRFGIVLIERGSEVGGGDQRTDSGTRSIITQAAAMTDGRWLLRVQGEARIAVEEWLPDDPYPRARVAEWPAPSEDAPSAGALLATTEQRLRRTRALLAEYGGAPAHPPDTEFDESDPVAAAWQLCAAAPVNAYDAQRLLTAETTMARLDLLSQLMDELELDLQRMHSPE